MSDFIIKRNYTTMWHSLESQAAINGLESSLLERKGVRKLWVSSCTPAQMGDKGYEMHVSYEENLDETFGFPENLDKVIFLDVDQTWLPYHVEKVALETKAGIVITTPSLKDDYYDVGNIFPTDLARLMEKANNSGVKIVGITPSISYSESDSDMFYAKMIEDSIIRYLRKHRSIKKFIIVSKEDMPKLSPCLVQGENMSDSPYLFLDDYISELSPYSLQGNDKSEQPSCLFQGDDIPWDSEKRAIDILNGQSLKKELKPSRPYMS